MIDAHQHFWQVTREDCHWPGVDLAPIYRDFLPGDYCDAVDGLPCEGSVLVQSQPNDSDTDYLLQLADEQNGVLAVVGWVDFSSTNATARLSELRERKKFCGVRPMLQSIEDERWILNESCRTVLDYLQESALTFDALIRPCHLPVIDELAECYPDLAIVIDHGAKPDIARDDYASWARQIERIAGHANVYCKLSGLVTEATQEQCEEQESLAPYVQHLYRCFGPGRLMWGSDWPVCGLRTTLRGWYELSLRLLQECVSPGEYHPAIKAIFSDNARAFYRIAG